MGHRKDQSCGKDTCGGKLINAQFAAAASASAAASALATVEAEAGGGCGAGGVFGFLGYHFGVSNCHFGTSFRVSCFGFGCCFVLGFGFCVSGFRRRCRRRGQRGRVNGFGPYVRVSC